jgi:hypothetical protein
LNFPNKSVKILSTDFFLVEYIVKFVNQFSYESRSWTLIHILRDLQFFHYLINFR